MLAVCAARLGFSPVTALDVEDAALEATQRNAHANGVDLDVHLGDALAESLPRAEAVTANVSREFLDRLAPRLDCAVLIASGYAESEGPGRSWDSGPWRGALRTAGPQTCFGARSRVAAPWLGSRFAF